MKAEPESYEEDEENKSKLGGGGEDVLEHEDVDPEVGDVLEVGEEVQPGRRDQEGSHGPLPALKQNHPWTSRSSYQRWSTHRGSRAAVGLRPLGLDTEVAGEDDGHDVDDPVTQVLQLEISPPGLKV